MSVETSHRTVEPLPRKRRWYLSPQLLLLLSTMLYFSPLLVGSFEYITSSGARIQHIYSNEVAAAAVFILAMLVALVGATGRRPNPITVGASYNVESKLLLASMVASGLYVLLSGNASIASKQLLLEETGRIDLVFYLLCSLGFVFAFLAGYRRLPVLLAASTIGLLYVMYMGHRSPLAIAVIGAAYVKFRDRPIPRIPLRYIGLAASLLVGMAVYKSIYIAVKLGDWATVLDRLSPNELLKSALQGMEQFTTFAHLDFAITSGLRLECTNIWLAPITIIPLLDGLLEKVWDVSGCYYNAQVQPLFFSGYRGGVAANIWAEFYGYFGYFGFPLLLALLYGFYLGIERAIRKLRSPVLIAGLIIALVNLSFYIQRKEFLGAFISGKRAFTVAVLIFAVSTAIRRINRRRLRPRV